MVEKPVKGTSNKTDNPETATSERMVVAAMRKAPTRLPTTSLPKLCCVSDSNLKSKNKKETPKPTATEIPAISKKVL
jgi:hypothetical protein